VSLPVLLVAAVAGVRYHQAEQHRRDGEYALGQHAYEQARMHFQQSLVWWPGRARVHFLLARAFRQLRHYDEAGQHLRQARLRGMDNDTVDLEFDLAAVQLGTAALAPELRARAEKDTTHGLAILEVLTQHYLDHYLLTDARACLDLYLEQQPDDLQALLGRGFIYERRQYFADALRDYRRAVAAHPQSDRARLKLAETLLIAGTPEEALEQFQALVEAHPERREVRLGLARCRRRLGQLDEAGRLLRELLRDHPSDADVLRESGELALDLDQPARAEPLLRRAVKRKPSDQHACNALVRCLRQLKRPAEAEQWQKRVEEIKNDLLQLQKITKAVQRNPNDARLRLKGGLLFLHNGEEQEGVRWLLLALRLDPNCAPARKALADYSRLGGRQRDNQTRRQPDKEKER
jgi:tetratricopeptide (TPR) repeat protein